MTAETMADFMALLLIGSVAGTTVAIAVPSARASLAAASVPLTALVAGGAMAGSLYFSEVADFVPCELCWWQRIAMYPLAVILVAAAVRRDRSVQPYVLIVGLLGLAIALYHVQLQQWPDQSSFCALDNPCSARWVEGLGFMTIPQMAATSFAFVVAVTALALITNRETT